jgi:hypothetical protein
MQEIKSAVAEKPTEREGTEGISPQRHRGHEGRRKLELGFLMGLKNRGPWNIGRGKRIAFHDT